MQGTLAPGVLPGLFRDLYVGRKTGLAHFTRGADRNSVRFRRGNIVDASTQAEGDHMGVTLMRHGLLTPEDNERCGALMTRDGKRLGQALQELGLMSREQVAQALALHVREVLLKLFAWSHGEYSFEELEPDPPGGEDVAQRLSTGEMILEAVRQVEDPDVVRYGLGNADRILIPSSDPLLRFQQITLSPVDGFLLSRVDGTLAAREVIDMAPVPSEEAEKSLFGLLCTGVVEYLPGPPKARAKRQKTGRFHLAQGKPVEAAPEPPPGQVGQVETAEVRRQQVIAMAEGLKSMTHFEVLGVPRASTEAQVKEAYFRLVKRFHPDTQHDPALADLAGDIEAIFIRVGQAYDVLRNARSRAQYEERLGPSRPTVVTGPSAFAGSTVVAGPSTPGTAPPKPTAATTDPQPRMTTPAPVRAEVATQALETALRAAEKLLAQEKYWEVIQTLEPLLGDAPKGRVKQRAQVTIAKAYLKNPNWVKKAEEELQQVVQADPASVEAYMLLGGIYKTGGLRARAVAMFRRALELKPDMDGAAAALKELGAAPEITEPQAGVGVFLKKLFKRS